MLKQDLNNLELVQTFDFKPAGHEFLLMNDQILITKGENKAIIKFNYELG